MKNVAELQGKFFSQLKDFAAIKEVLDNISDVGFFVKNTDGEVVFLNKFSRDVINVKNENEIVGKMDYHLYPKEMGEHYKKEDFEVMKTGRCVFDGLTMGPEYSNRTIFYNKIPLYGKNGKIIGVAGFFRFTDKDKHLPEFYAKISQVIDFIHSNYTEKISMEDLAKIGKISKKQITKHFLKYFGCSAYDYIIKVRVNAAKALLEKTDRTLTDIALSTGFCDHSHLSKNFKKHKDRYPNEYRKMQKKKFTSR